MLLILVLATSLLPMHSANDQNPLSIAGHDPIYCFQVVAWIKMKLRYLDAPRVVGLYRLVIPDPSFWGIDGRPDVLAPHQFLCRGL